MPTVTLPDGSSRSYDAPVAPATIAADIGPGLAKAAMLAVVDGQEIGGGRTLEFPVQRKLDVCCGEAGRRRKDPKEGHCKRFSD